MPNFIKICLLLSTLLLACKQYNPDIDQLAIKAVLQQQQDAWNTGDIPSFMSYYAQSDSISFTGSKGISYGWTTILNNYIKAYPDQETMGQLKFDILNMKNLGQEHFLVLGKFTLIRTNDQPSGYFSLVFEKQESGWKIIADHTS